MLYTNIMMYVKHISIEKAELSPTSSSTKTGSKQGIPLKGYGKHLQMTGVKVKGNFSRAEQ